ncbi:glycosyltransferase family 4 protein [Curtobacterium sp. ISL-83]|uniref:glycosyltransferase family 4 protein n=1 Tax=Curtobacterium sp. ISL-83 TaxID=2819145 RepID=UPI001BE61C0B|nr:glycosyltransferase family 4 protein [Curtobacterium sp. ISL-83]MBT2501646.1 glycosyltransferase family 4 protein [Curtobacterium sp. ISL-83]
MTIPRALRIGVVTNGLPIIGGVERCVLEDTRELVEAGHHVEVWHRPARSGRPDDGKAPYDRIGVPTHLASDYRFSVRTAPRDVLRFVREGLRIRRAHLDVLWLNRPEHLLWGRVVSTIAGVPLAVHLHHAPNYRRVAPFAGGRTHFFAVSHVMARAWADVGVPADRITIVPNGVDTAAFPSATPAEVFRARRALGIDLTVQTVLYYGRLTRAKGVVALLEAWGRVLAQVPARQAAAGGGTSEQHLGDPLLVLAGPLVPDDALDVRRAIASLPAGSVLVLPERDDVVPLLHAADLVVAPSIEPEGFGRVVVEAMSAGHPVVASAAGGTGEILAGEWARFTVDPLDADALAGSVLRALGEVRESPSLSVRSRAFVRDHHGRAQHVSALLRALLEHAQR